MQDVVLTTLPTPSGESVVSNSSNMSSPSARIGAGSRKVKQSMRVVKDSGKAVGGKMVEGAAFTRARVRNNTLLVMQSLGLGAIADALGTETVLQRTSKVQAVLRGRHARSAMKAKDKSAWADMDTATGQKKEKMAGQAGGHPGTFKTDGVPEGQLLKETSTTEARLYQLVQGTEMQTLMPAYFGSSPVAPMPGELTDTRLVMVQFQNLTAGCKRPCVMDIKMGVRTFLESEVSTPTLHLAVPAPPQPDCRRSFTRNSHGAIDPPHHFPVARHSPPAPSSPPPGTELKTAKGSCREDDESRSQRGNGGGEGVRRDETSVHAVSRAEVQRGFLALQAKSCHDAALAANLSSCHCAGVPTALRKLSSRGARRSSTHTHGWRIEAIVLPESAKPMPKIDTKTLNSDVELCKTVAIYVQQREGVRAALLARLQVMPHTVQARVRAGVAWRAFASLARSGRYQHHRWSMIGRPRVPRRKSCRRWRTVSFSTAWR